MAEIEFDETCPTGDMSDHIIGDLASARWLLWQATFSYRALIPLALISVWNIIEARQRRVAAWSMALPVFWLTPIALAGAFTDWNSHEAKTAGWIGGAALLAMGLQVAASVMIILLLKGQRVLAGAAVLVNGVIGLFTLFVVSMDASGDWLCPPFRAVAKVRPTTGGLTNVSDVFVSYAHSTATQANRSQSICVRLASLSGSTTKSPLIVSMQM